MGTPCLQHTLEERLEAAFSGQNDVLSLREVSWSDADGIGSSDDSLCRRFSSDS